MALAKIDPRLIDRIYEAAVMTKNWPALLQGIADQLGAKGAVYRGSSPDWSYWLASPKLERAIEDYVAEGWGASPEYAAPFLAELYPGFRTETDYRSVAELEAMKVYSDFMKPRDWCAGSGTIVQGLNDDLVTLTLEGFGSHDSARNAIPTLDALRPHLARSLAITAALKKQSRLIVTSLSLAGIAAAIVGSEGRLRAANDGFVKRMGNRMIENRFGLRFTDRFLQDQFARALAHHRAEQGSVQSVAIRDDGELPLALHILPITGAVKEVCESDGVLLLLADPANRSVPGADLLRLLFDLTPAEARLTRLLLEGLTLADAAKRLKVSEMTARVQLRGVFAKTGVNRQADLARLLTGLGRPS